MEEEELDQSFNHMMKLAAMIKKPTPVRILNDKGDSSKHHSPHVSGELTTNQLWPRLNPVFNNYKPVDTKFKKDSKRKIDMPKMPVSTS